MDNSKEKGITLMALVMTVVVMLILASIGTNSGIQVLKYAEYNDFVNELKEMQIKVNELNQSKNYEIGTEVSKVSGMQEKLDDILSIDEISKIVFGENTTEEEKEKIKNGFRYCSNDYIKNGLNMDGIKKDYLINVEYRFIIYPKGFEYKENKYYMINQFDYEIYNVKYNQEAAQSYKNEN